MPVGIAAIAALSLLAPFEPLYDPWAWLVWGRELAALELDTGAGPSWKPLPVLVTTLLSPAGGAAPELWLFVARTGWLAAVALAYRLAWRLMFPVRVATGLASRFASGRVRLARNLAGALAAIGLALLFDPFTAWTRQFAGGLTEPLLVALVLGAVDRGLSDRRGQALGLGFAAALLRPETWPLLAIYAVWAWRGPPRLRRWIVAGAVALPALWLVPDLLGSGDALTGAERAREATGGAVHETMEALCRAIQMPPAALWAGAAVCVVSAWRHAEREPLVLAGGAAAWMVIVAVLAGAGYAGLPRFAAPAAAVVCVLGAVGLVRAVAAIDGMRASNRARRPAIALVGLLVAGLAVQAAIRLGEIPGELDRARAYANSVEDLEGAAGAVGDDRIDACPPPTVTDYLFLPQLAWTLDLPLTGIEVAVQRVPAAGIAFAGRVASPAARALDEAGTPIARSGEWTAYEVSCPAASGASGIPIALVAGASR